MTNPSTHGREQSRPSAALPGWTEALEEGQSPTLEAPTDGPFQAMFQHVALGMALLDMAGRCQLANPYVQEWLGYSTAELRAMPLRDLNPPGDPEDGFALFQKLAAGELEAYTLERRFLKKSGVIAWARSNLSLVRDGQGKPAYAVVMLEDITERKRAESELETALVAVRASEERLRLATDAGEVGIWDLDIPTGALKWSPKLEDIFGFAPGTFPGTLTDFRATLHPDDRDRVIAAIAETQKPGGTGFFAHEHRIVRQDGSVAYLAARGAASFDAQGNPLRMTGTAVDITARRQLELERASVSHALGERIKELTALHGAASLLLDAALDTGEALRRIVDLLPPAWQYPEITAARISFDGVSASTDRFRLTPWYLSARFETPERGPVVVEVVYLESPIDADPFLPEERQLLKSLVEMLAGYFERQHHARMQRHYAHSLARVQEEERRNLARELHDEVGQSLTGLQLLLGLARRSPAEVSDGRLVEAQALIGELLGQVRDLALNLRPAMLDDLGLIPTLMWLRDRLVSQTGILVDLQHEDLYGRRFDPDVETAAYRIIQESLTNVVRHAHAEAATVRLWADAAALHLAVEDDGRGFDPASWREGSSTGLASMRERAAAVGGTVSIGSSLGQGTAVSARLVLTEVLVTS